MIKKKHMDIAKKVRDNAPLDLRPKDYGNLWGGKPVRPQLRKPKSVAGSQKTTDLRRRPQPSTPATRRVEPPHDTIPTRESDWASTSTVTKPKLEESTKATTPRGVYKSRTRTQPKSIATGAKSIVIYGLLVVGGLVFGIASFNLEIGQWIIIAIGILAILFKAKSNYIFGTALFALVMVPLLQALGRETLSENYAVYSYLLLVFGTIAAILELRREKKQEKGARKSK